MQKNMHILAIDEAKFKKTSKKLLSKLNEQHSLNLKLNSIQELLAEALGYRNLFALQKVFEEGQPEPINDKVDLFKGLSAGQSTQIFVNLIDGEDGMWKGRAISLISSVMMALIYMRDHKEILLDTSLIREHLILNNIVKLYKNRKDLPSHVGSALRAYLVSLPGFQESAVTQTITTNEQHGYLQMQISPIVDKLKYLEQDNFVIASTNWFDPGTFVLKKELKDLDCVDLSWIDMEAYRDWIYKALKKNKILRVSDLLLYTSMIISPQKKVQMCFLLSSILNNFDTASAISKEIESMC